MHEETPLSTFVRDISFTKFHCAGNDFVLIEDLEGQFPIAETETIQRLCDRVYGIGADGLILLQPSEKADFRMLFFNCDGNVGKMCGNGLCCLARFISKLGLQRTEFQIETDSGIFSCFDRGENVEILMPEPTVLEWEKPYLLEGNTFPLYLIEAGVRHAVVWLSNFDQILFESAALLIRHDPLFQPEGVNVNFAVLKNSQEVEVRTFEKGVERETKACGTGALSVATVFFRLLEKKRLSIVFHSGERLEVSAEQTSCGNRYCLKGPVIQVYSGIVSVPNQVLAST